MENIIGMMEEFLEECGKMDYKMEKGKYMNLVKIKQKKEFGKMEKELNGLIEIHTCLFIIILYFFIFYLFKISFIKKLIIFFY